MVALCVRLIPNLFLPMGAGYDIESYQIVGNLVLHKENVYTSQEAMRRHPYLPLQMYWMAFSLWFAQTFNLPFVKIVRLAPIFADAGIATWITFRLHNRLPLPSAFRGGLLYALNPITVFVSAYHGQFDAIPVLLTLVAIEVIEVSPLGSGLVLGLGILDKSWPVLALPSLLAAVRNWRQRFSLALGCVLIPALGTLAYALLFKASLWAIIHRAISYDWGIGVWGYTYFFHRSYAVGWRT
jgi:Gpi18-like mannosyltransferase